MVVVLVFFTMSVSPVGDTVLGSTSYVLRQAQHS